MRKLLLTLAATAALSAGAITGVNATPLATGLGAVVDTAGLAQPVTYYYYGGHRRWHGHHHHWRGWHYRRHHHRHWY